MLLTPEFERGHEEGYELAIELVAVMLELEKQGRLNNDNIMEMLDLDSETLTKTLLDMITL